MEIVVSSKFANLFKDSLADKIMELLGNLKASLNGKGYFRNKMNLVSLRGPLMVLKAYMTDHLASRKSLLSEFPPIVQMKI